MTDTWIALCRSTDLRESDQALPFDVVYAGQTCRAFAVRHQGQVQAYLNRCTHVAMELDYQPNQVWDTSRQWLICATHGALYSPQSGQCAGGPCRGGLKKIAVAERDGVVHWHTEHNLQPLEF
jgi:nitrite reductase/ring-hydroxylating ferredoxin subunit